MISEERVRKVFTELVAIDSESFGEKEIGGIVAARLRELGLEVITDAGTDPAFLQAHPDSFPNIFGRLKGTVPGEPVSTHPPYYARINFTAAHFDKFYESYPSVTEGTPMYIAPEDRILIW